ncbi:MAG: MFS transporter [Coxiellaceae bacterium]|nr:MAG: MFS transporter [Coxiellaceae bacterium]
MHSCCYFSFFNLFQISVFNSISAGLMTDFHLSSLQMGWFSATYLIANTLWLVPGGLLIDRYSARHTALLFAFLDVMACFVISISHHLLVSIMMRFIQGMASAMSLLICARFANRWFANKATLPWALWSLLP